MQANTNVREAQTVGWSSKLHLTAVDYVVDGEQPPVTSIDDVMVLIRALIRPTLDLIGSCLNYVAALPDSPLVRSLRTQLHVALAILLDFVSRIIRVTQFNLPISWIN